ncbi:unnamed protein product, partial [Laminaria digitata]
MNVLLNSFVRQAKEAAVAKNMEELRSSNPDSPVFKILEQAEAGSVTGDGPEFPLSSVLRKNKGTLSVVAEYRKIIKSGFIDGILAPELLCPLFRNGGAGCVAVATESQTGGCSEDDLRRVVADQENSRGDFPGPMPVIVRYYRYSSARIPSDSYLLYMLSFIFFFFFHSIYSGIPTLSIRQVISVVLFPSDLPGLISNMALMALKWIHYCTYVRICLPYFSSSPAFRASYIHTRVCFLMYSKRFSSFSFAFVLKYRDLVISEFEIARAKEEGAVGVTVVLALVGPERCAELAAFCKKIGV